MKRIFLITSERSGSNLLRTFLNNHSQINAPVAPHYLNAFAGFIDLYGDLSKKKNMVLLLGDMITLANHPFNDWKWTKKPENLYNELQPSSFVSAIDAIYSGYATSKNKSSYACKGNDLYNYLSRISMNHSDAIFIYLYRDVRDQVASWMKKPLFLHTPYDAATKWTQDQKSTHRWINSYGVSVCPISYESLVSNPQKEMQRILNYVGLPFEEACAQTSSKNIESRRNPLWKNLSKPVMTNNFNKYKKVLSKKDLLIVESVAHKEMLALGYSMDTQAKWNRTPCITGLIMRFTRIYAKWKNRNFINKTMADVHGKITLINSFKKRMLHANKHK